MCVVGKYIYVVVGCDYYNDLSVVECYDFVINFWDYVVLFKKEVYVYVGIIL